MKHLTGEQQLGFASRAVSLSAGRVWSLKRSTIFLQGKQPIHYAKNLLLVLKYCMIGRMKHVSDVSHDSGSATGRNADSAAKGVI